jgi:uncharacterized protein DUF1877
MACRGVHFAITSTDAGRLVTAATPDNVLEFIQEDIEKKWDKEWLYQTDKAWDTIHRCLTDGTLNPTTGAYPLKLAVLNGRQIDAGPNYIVSLTTPAEAKDVASSLAAIDRAWFQNRYNAIEQKGYWHQKSEQDLEYAWDWFKGLDAFFLKAANAQRHVIFTVDQ